VTPSGPDWHRELLRQMTVEVADLRPAALSPATALKLGDYLSFRHLVRQIYTFNLDPQRLRPLVEGLPELYRGVQSDLGAFVAFLDGIGHAG
jgi:hypothetical protein